MDKKNVQKSIWRNLFAQKRAALGKLRNFFGAIFARAYMVLNIWKSFLQKCDHIAKKGRNRVQQSPKQGFLFSEKMFLRFRDCLRRPFAREDVPF